MGIVEVPVLRRVGWGPFRMPGERKRMERLKKELDNLLEGFAKQAEGEREAAGYSRLSQVFESVAELQRQRLRVSESSMPGFLDDLDNDEAEADDTGTEDDKSSRSELEAAIEHSRAAAVASLVADDALVRAFRHLAGSMRPPLRLNSEEARQVLAKLTRDVEHHVRGVERNVPPGSVGATPQQSRAAESGRASSR